MQENVRVVYLYRDATNYKSWAEVVFRSEAGWTPEKAAEEIRCVCDMGNLFVARQVRLPVLYDTIDGTITADDHSFHEFHSAEATNEPVTDLLGRSIGELVGQFLLAGERGWQPYDLAEASWDGLGG